ncbi:MAG: T9SS type A sorting domain-containing protein, partial [Bacteroidota bacterium]
ISETPRVVIDGFTSPDKSRTSDLLFTDNDPEQGWGDFFYNKRTLQLAALDIDVEIVNKGDNLLYVKPVITAKNDKVNDDYVVHVVVVEDSLTSQDLGITSGSLETNFYSTVRKMLPNAAGTKFLGGLAKDASITLDELKWIPADLLDIDNIVEGNISVVVFVQDEKTREVHQSEVVNLGDILDLDLVLGIKDELKADGIALYPNPADNRITIKLANKSSVEHTAFIFDNTGKQMGEIRINPGQDMIELNTAEYTPGLYLFTVPTESGAVVKRFVIKH